MNFVSRAINTLTQPKPEMARAAGEPGTTQGVILGYAVPMAALPAIAQLIGALIFAGSYISYILGTVITGLVLTYVLRDLGLTIGIGFGLAALAPNFGGQRNPVGAMKLAVYAATPIWIAGFIAALLAYTGLAGLGILFVLAGFGLAGYIIYVGCGPLLGIPPQQQAVVAGITTVAWLVLWYVVGMIIANVAIGSMGIGRYGV